VVTGEPDFVRDDARFRRVLDELPAAVYTTDALGHITYYNEAAAELWGHRPALGVSEWCGSWKLYWPDGTVLPHGDCPMAIAIKEKRAVRGKEAVAERPDGTRVPFIPYPTPLFDNSGALVGAVNMLVDISDRKQVEELYQRLAAIVESSDDAIISKDLNGIVSSWNKGAERLFGYTAKEAVGQSITMLIPEDRIDEEEAILNRIRKGERLDHFETVRRHKDGSLVELSITVSPVKDAMGRITGASKIARDITERKRAHEQQNLLLGEMKHRTKNLVAVIDAIARQSRPRDDQVAAAFMDTFVGRLRALFSIGEIVIGSSDRRAGLADVFEITLKPFVNPDKPTPITIEGPHMEVSEQTAGGVALAVHELATNALKYGALKSPQGRISLVWSVDESGKVSIDWKERGGPRVYDEPKQRGFGSRVIRSSVAHEPDGMTELLFEPDGVRCRFTYRNLTKAKQLDTHDG
jgi:PAS domain S-box-containing protein